MTTIAVRFDPRHNSLNAIRLVLATLVIVSHEWPVGGYGLEPKVANATLGEWAVAGFFCISGYLIATSKLNSSFGNFLLRRVLRIYPGFLVCLAMIVLVFAPFSVAVGSGSVDWSNAASYFAHNSLLKIQQNGIANTLADAPFGDAWNGSLWTLFYEFACYVGIGILLSLARRWHRPLVVLTWVGCIAVDLVASHTDAVSSTTIGNLARLGAFFFAGSVIALYAGRIRLNWQLAAFAGVATVVLAQIGYISLSSLLMAYAYLWLGAALPFQAVGRKNDISYGIYIYAFPVQQTLNLFDVNELPIGVAIVIAIAATVPFAVASWFGIERPALALKRRLGRRRNSHRRPDARSATPAPSDSAGVSQ